MGVGLSNSTIERFRLRTHPHCVLAVYQLSADGQSLKTLATVTKYFLLTPDQDAGEGARPFTLVIDTGSGLAEVTGDQLGKASMFDLKDTLHNTFQRYRINTDVQPLITDWRYQLNVHASYGDKKPVDV